MKIKRICAFLCGVVIILSSFTSCAIQEKPEPETEHHTETTQEQTSAGKMYTIRTDDNVPINLHTKPGTDHPVIVTIQNGKKVELIDQQGSWANVKYNGYTGWINLGPADKETTTAYQEETVKTTSVASPTKPSDIQMTSAKPVSTKKPSATTKPSTTKPQSGYLYSYAGFNPKEISISADSWNLTLLNRHYTLPENYVPQLAEAVKGSGVYLDYRVAPHYQKMYDAALKDGITLTPNSGYRSYQTQKNNFENKIKYYTSQGYDKATAAQNAARVILLPGTSEHNAGLAMDIGWVTEDFENSPAFAWLSEHAQDYGFIMRYPKSEAKQAITEIIYEPWHWRYVGVDTAKAMKSSGQVLEEYLGVK